MIDAGETINIGAILRNRWGMSKDTVVKIDAMSNLGVANPYVEILTDTVQFDGVGTYSTKDNLTRAENGAYTGAENPLVVKIDKECPNDYVINLNVTVTFGNGLDDSDTAIYENPGMISFAVRNGVVLPSQITEDMTLTKDNYYIIPNSTVIKEGVTVTVDPGTKIQFWSNDPEDPYADQYIAYLQVEGNFITNGTLEEPVELFPSELMDEYVVEIEEVNEGRVEFNYTNVTNASIDISVADHCKFTQNYAGDICKRYVSGGKIIMNPMAYSSCISHNRQELSDILNNLKGQLVMAITAYISSGTTINNQNIPFNNLNKIYCPSGFNATLLKGVVTLTLPQGNYIAKINASCWTNNNSWDYMLLNIRKGSSTIARAMAPKPYGVWGFVNCEGILEVSNNDELSAYLNTLGNNFSDGNVGSADTKMDIMVYKI